MNNINPIKIEFEKLLMGATFYDKSTNRKWVKVDETGAVRENDPYDTIGAFEPNEIVIVE
jgi:hypothetical protein